METELVPEVSESIVTPDSDDDSLCASSQIEPQIAEPIQSLTDEIITQPAADAPLPTDTTQMVECGSRSVTDTTPPAADDTPISQDTPAAPVIDTVTEDTEPATDAPQPEPAIDTPEPATEPAVESAPSPPAEITGEFVGMTVSDMIVETTLVTESDTSNASPVVPEQTVETAIVETPELVSDIVSGTTFDLSEITPRETITEPLSDAELTPELSAEQTAESTPEPAAESAAESTSEPAAESTPGPAAEPASESTSEIAAELTPESATGPISESATEPTPAPAAELAVELVLEPVVEPVLEPTPEPAAESAAEPTPEPAVELALESASEPAAEPTPEPAAEPTPEPADEPTPEPAAEPTPEPAAEPTPEPAAEPTPEPAAEPAIEPAVEPTPEPADEPAAEPTPEPATESTVEPTPEPATESVPEPTIGTAVEPAAESAVEPAAEPTPDPAAESIPESAIEPALVSELTTPQVAESIMDERNVSEFVDDEEPQISTVSAVIAAAKTADVADVHLEPEEVPIVGYDKLLKDRHQGVVQQLKHAISISKIFAPTTTSGTPAAGTRGDDTVAAEAELREIKRTNEPKRTEVSLMQRQKSSIIDEIRKLQQERPPSNYDTLNTPRQRREMELEAARREASKALLPKRPPLDVTITGGNVTVNAGGGRVRTIRSRPLIDPEIHREHYWHEKRNYEVQAQQKQAADDAAIGAREKAALEAEMALKQEILRRQMSVPKVVPNAVPDQPEALGVREVASSVQRVQECKDIIDQYQNAQSDAERAKMLDDISAALTLSIIAIDRIRIKMRTSTNPLSRSPSNVSRNK